MRKLTAVLLGIIIFVFCIPGCNPSPRLLGGQAINIATRYNEISPFHNISFENAFPIDKGLTYFLFTSPYRKDPAYQIYLIENPAEVVPNYSERVSYYHIPKEIVEEYILDFFSSIDYSAGTQRESPDGKCYLFSSLGGGSGLLGLRLQIDEIEQSGKTATFRCDALYEKTGEVYFSQRFTVRYESGQWKVLSVELLFIQE